MLMRAASPRTATMQRLSAWSIHSLFAPQHIRPIRCLPTAPAFIAMTLGSPVMVPQAAGAQAAPTSAASAAASSDIRIECCHHGTLVTVNWPVGAAAECSRALQGLLQVLRQ